MPSALAGAFSELIHISADHLLILIPSIPEIVNEIKKPTNRAESRGGVLFLVKKLIFTKIMVLKLLIPSIFWGVITVLVRQVGNNEDS